MSERTEPSGSPDATAEIVVAVSHELRSPLASLRGFTQMLLDRWERLDDADRRDLLQQIEHDAARMSRLVDELLDVSRISAQRFTVWPRRVDLVGLAQRVVRHVQAAHPEMQCRVEAAPALPDVLVDPDRIEQLLTNLLENGAKYATPDRLSIRIVREVDAAGEPALVVTVDDEGPGLSPAERARVFERFTASSGGRPSGLGLGLWIAREIAEAHGGTLRAEGNARGGTTFRLTVPVPTPTD
jgi:signal transduction histidine kinase